MYMNSRIFETAGAIVLWVCLSLEATTYFVDAGSGNDSGPGTEAQPWQTLDKVNNSGDLIDPGDSLLLKRGQTWRGRLIPRSGSLTGGRITYGAYGDPTDAKPLILGSVELNSPSNWTPIGTNLWQTTAPVDTTYGISNVIYNNGAFCGYLCQTLDSLISRQTQGDWYQDPNYYITVYSDTIPSTYYSDIEMAVSVTIIVSGSYVTLQDLDLRYGGFHGIQFVMATDITVADCDLSFMGGAGIWDWRLGNGIEFIGSAAHALIERCNIWNIWDSGITQQGNASAHVQHDMIYRNNILGKCDYASYEGAWLSGDAALISNIHFENNTCIDAGKGWTQYQHRHGGWPIYGIHLLVSLDPGKVSNFYVRNNIFYETTGALLCVKDSAQPGMTIDYNAYFTTAAYVADCWRTAYDMTKFAEYQTKTGYDAHSFAAPIGMVDPANLDFHLKSVMGHWNSFSKTWVKDGEHSPAIDAGDPGFDWSAEPMPNGSRINIGAYGNTSQASLSARLDQ